MNYEQLNKNISPLDGNSKLISIDDDMSSFNKNDIENIINQLGTDIYIFNVKDITDSLVDAKDLFSNKPNVVLQLKITEEGQLNKLDLFKSFDCDKYLLFELDKNFVIYANDKRLHGIKFITIKTTKFDYAKRLIYCCNVNNVNFSLFNSGENQQTINYQMPEILNNHYKIFE